MFSTPVFVHIVELRRTRRETPVCFKQLKKKSSFCVKFWSLGAKSELWWPLFYNLKTITDTIGNCTTQECWNRGVLSYSFIVWQCNSNQTKIAQFATFLNKNDKSAAKYSSYETNTAKCWIRNADFIRFHGKSRYLNFYQYSIIITINIILLHYFPLTS